MSRSFYSPVPEPPIDYTIRVKRQPRKVLDTVSTSSTEHTSHETARVRRNTEEETEQILGDLDSVLMSAAAPFEELRKKVENFNISYKPYKEGSEVVETTSEPNEPIPRARAKSKKPTGNGVVPIFSKEIIHDIKNVNRGADVKKLNEEHALSVEEMHRKTLEKIEKAKKAYSTSYFFPQYEKEGVPVWKQHLLAEKKSRQTLKKIEEEAWEFYEKWKKIFYPKSTLEPVYQFSGKPQVKAPSRQRLNS